MPFHAAVYEFDKYINYFSKDDTINMFHKLELKLNDNFNKDDCVGYPNSLILITLMKHKFIKIALKFLEKIDSTEDFTTKYNGITNLQYAIDNKHKNIAMKLIKKFPTKCGLNIKIVKVVRPKLTRYSSEKKTVKSFLYYVIELKYYDLVEEMLKHLELCNVNYRCDSKDSEIYLCIKNQEYDLLVKIIKLYFKSGFYCGDSSLVYKLCSKNKKAALEIITLYKNIQSKPEYWKDSLFLCITHGYEDMAQLIITNHPEVCGELIWSSIDISSRSDDGIQQTFLIYAIRNNMEKIALKILDYPEFNKYDYTDKLKLNALSWAFSREMKTVMEKINLQKKI